MQFLTPEQLAAISSRKLVKRSMVLFSLGSGNHGFWWGRGDLVWNSITFRGGGQLIEVEQDETGLGLEANGLVLRLYEQPKAGLTATVLATIHNEQTRLRPVTFYEALFDPASRVMIGNPVVTWRGRILTTETKEEGRRAFIEARCESRNYDNTRRNLTMANEAHHGLVAATDRIFQYAGTIPSMSIYFGKPVPKGWTPPVKVTP